MNWEQIIIAIILTAVIPLIKWGLEILKDYVEAKIKTLDDQKLAGIICDAYSTVSNVVLYVMQTYVDSLKKKGEFDALAQKEALNMARKRATDLINDTAKEAIEEKYGDFSMWLDTQIEDTVRICKG